MPQGAMPLDDILYDNGPVNGTTDAWTINFGFVISNTFTVPSGGATLTSLSFGAWLFPGDVLQSVEVSITDSELGGNTYFDGVVNFTQSDCIGNQYGFNVCTETASLSVNNLAQGTYWLNLQNATVNTGDPVYWDENSGPSLASENSVGTIPSEAFTVLGNYSEDYNRCMPEVDGGFKVIHDFTGEGDGGEPRGVAIDGAGNLYGATEAGTVYKMADVASGWLLSLLYTFTDEHALYGQNVVVGRNGVLYGASGSGFPSCPSGQSCGSVFRLRPSATICGSVSCSWTENVIYSFTGSTDAWRGGHLVADQAGNLYGISYSGGAHQQGAIFQLSPSLGGWIETILYSFTGNSDGAGPVDLILGNDGTLFGTADSGGAYANGVVFQLTQSLATWSETVLYNFYNFPNPKPLPYSLLQDGSGNLFAVSEGGDNQGTYGVVYMLTPSNGQWIFSELRRGERQYLVDEYRNLALISDGRLLGTGEGISGCYNGIPHGYIFELERTEQGWEYHTPVFWDNASFYSTGNLAIGSHGDVYGTTYSCGRHRRGTVWQFAP